MEAQVHLDATGTTLADASFQWCPSGDPVLIWIIETHWNTTGRPLEAHWKRTGYKQFLLQWHSSVHWGLSSRHTGFPLDCHWITTGSGQGSRRSGVRIIKYEMSHFICASRSPVANMGKWVTGMHWELMKKKTAKFSTAKCMYIYRIYGIFLSVVYWNTSSPTTMPRILSRDHAVHINGRLWL